MKWPSRRVIVTILLSVAVVGFVGLPPLSGYLMASASAKALSSTHRIFYLSSIGRLGQAESEGLISTGAAAVLRSVGDKSGRFGEHHAKIDAVQAMGTPCLVLVTARQGHATFLFGLEVNWGCCVFADVE